MKLFRFDNGEQVWVAAETQEQAVRLYMHEYGLDETDMTDVEISEVDPLTVQVWPDDWDYDKDPEELPTAAEYMDKPGLVCSTCQ